MFARLASVARIVLGLLAIALAGYAATDTAPGAGGGAFVLLVIAAMLFAEQLRRAGRAAMAGFKSAARTPGMQRWWASLTATGRLSIKVFGYVVLAACVIGLVTATIGFWWAIYAVVAALPVSVAIITGALIISYAIWKKK